MAWYLPGPDIRVHAHFLQEKQSGKLNALLHIGSSLLLSSQQLCSYVHLIWLPDQMPEVTRDWERIEATLPSSKWFADAHASWAVSSAMPAQTPIMGFYHFSTAAVTPGHGFSTPAPFPEVGQVLWKFWGLVIMLQLTLEEQRFEGILTMELYFWGISTWNITNPPGVACEPFVNHRL